MGEQDVLVDVRTYTIKPGFIPAQLEVYEKFGYPVQLRHIGQPLCYLQSESGEMNTLVHAWVYDNAADREQRRAAMNADPDWKAYLAENRRTGYVVAQRTSLMTPVGFCPPLKR